MMAKRKKKTLPVLHIGPHPIKVRFTDDWTFTNDKNGLSNGDRLEIVLAADLLKPGRESLLREVLVHECLHQISAHYELDLDERMVRQLGMGLAQMLEPFLKVEL